MDKHYLTPLFSPASIVVFAGGPDQADSQTGLARALERLLVSPGLRHQMGQRARRKAVEDWSARLHIERLLATFAKAQAPS